jgi:hypothetical protein
MEYVLVPLTNERIKALHNCCEDNCHEECSCFMKDDCVGNYHKLSEIYDKMQNTINEYMRLADIKISGEYFPNIDRIQVIEHAKGIIEEILNKDQM